MNEWKVSLSDRKTVSERLSLGGERYKTSYLAAFSLPKYSRLWVAHRLTLERDRSPHANHLVAGPNDKCRRHYTTQDNTM